MNLTKRQFQVLEYIRQYQAKHQLSPTLDEIASSFSVSKVTVFEHLQALEKKGFIRKTPNHSRSIEILTPSSAPVGLSILGKVAAGRPIEAVESPEAFDLTSLIPSGGDCYVLQVEGNSMIDEQIRDGDYVLVEKRTTAHNGETVVALVDGEDATLKKFYREKNRIRLQPANSEMDPIYPVDVAIQGIVIGVIRKY